MFIVYVRRQLSTQNFNNFINILNYYYYIIKYYCYYYIILMYLIYKKKNCLSFLPFNFYYLFEVVFFGTMITTVFFHIFMPSCKSLSANVLIAFLRFCLDLVNNIKMMAFLFVPLSWSKNFIVKFWNDERALGTNFRIKEEQTIGFSTTRSHIARCSFILDFQNMMQCLFYSILPILPLWLFCFPKMKFWLWKTIILSLFCGFIQYLRVFLKHSHVKGFMK